MTINIINDCLTNYLNIFININHTSLNQSSSLRNNCFFLHTPSSRPNIDLFGLHNLHLPKMYSHLANDMKLPISQIQKNWIQVCPTYIAHHSVWPLSGKQKHCVFNIHKSSMVKYGRQQQAYRTEADLVRTTTTLTISVSVLADRAPRAALHPHVISMINELAGQTVAVWH